MSEPSRTAQVGGEDVVTYYHDGFGGRVRVDLDRLKAIEDLTDEDRELLSTAAVAPSSETEALLSLIERLTGESIVPADGSERSHGQPEKWLVGTYRGWSVSRVPVPPLGRLPRFAAEADRGFPWFAERGKDWIQADSYEYLLDGIDREMAGAA